MTFPITSLYAIPLALTLLVLWMMVSMRRGKLDVAIGDGGDPGLLAAMRRHGNLAETLPVSLILMMLAEAGGAGGWVLHLAGIVLVVSRILHPIGIDPARPSHPLRLAGAMGTLVTILWLVGVLAVQHWGG